ncbi:hypothetical protein [Blastopirellula retiformator]|uniref:Uncharacterized protein n=1 Tax=Blastopirellula retiformator TaxID=2527970 RepID=A0A5C5UYX7_9BACT|nr:hypothetical protein [Blastopirellula retiformator]TWT30692.1 hypothetical protein Enr8_42150 [Blastopirellula retiformator]
MSTVPATSAFSSKLGELLRNAKDQLSGQFSWSLFAHVVLTFIWGAMIAAKEELTNSGAVKKEAVLKWVQSLLKYAVPRIPRPWWLFWMKNQSVIDVLMMVASAAIEVFYTQSTEKFKGSPDVA